MKDSKTLLANTSSLFVIQIASYILPLILIPYLTRVLGLETYGLVAFGMSIVAIGGILTDFGFDLYGPYVLSTRRDDRLATRRFIGAVFASKALLFLAAALALGVFILSSAKYRAQAPFFFLLLMPMLGTAFQPNWFFQGIEKMGTVTRYYLLSRFVYIGLALLLVKGPQDVLWVMAAFGAAQLVGAALCVLHMTRIGYAPLLPTIADIRQALAGAREYFYSRAAVATYTAGGGFFLGLFSNPAQVAYFHAAEQLYKGAQGLVAPVANALYPFMARTHNFRIFGRIFVASSVAGLIGIAIGVVIGRPVIGLVFGNSFGDAYLPLVLFLSVLAVNIPSVLLGYPFLGAIGHANFVNRSVIVAGIVQVAILVGLAVSNYASAHSVVLAVLMAEVTVLTLRAKKALSMTRYAAKAHPPRTEGIKHG